MIYLSKKKNGELNKVILGNYSKGAVENFENNIVNKQHFFKKVNKKK